MASAPRPVRFDSATPWADALERLNEFLHDVRVALNGRLSVEDNLLMQFKEIEFVGESADVIVRTRFRRPVKGVTIQYIADENGEAPAAASYCEWEPTTDGNRAAIKIRWITGLTSGDRYTVRLLVIGG